MKKLLALFFISLFIAQCRYITPTRPILEKPQCDFTIDSFKNRFSVKCKTEFDSVSQEYFIDLRYNDIGGMYFFDKISKNLQKILFMNSDSTFSFKEKFSEGYWKKTGSPLVLVTYLNNQDGKLELFALFQNIHYTYDRVTLLKDEKPPREVKLNVLESNKAILYYNAVINGYTEKNMDSLKLQIIFNYISCDGNETRVIRDISPNVVVK